MHKVPFVCAHVASKAIDLKQHSPFKEHQSHDDAVAVFYSKAPRQLP